MTDHNQQTIKMLARALKEQRQKEDELFLYRRVPCDRFNEAIRELQALDTWDKDRKRRIIALLCGEE